MRHLRVTHSKFSILKESKETTNDEGGLALPGTSAALGGPPEPLDFSGGPILTNLEPLSNTNPWSRQLEGDCDFGPREAEKCLHWAGEKVLEHAGFQGMCADLFGFLTTLIVFAGTSKTALDVFTGVASEYLLNVGRTIQFLSEKYGKKMSPEVRSKHNVLFHRTYPAHQEIILHTLFESGITRVGDLEQYIQDDVVRYGSRLSELGKKLDNAYQEIVRSTKPCLT